MPVLYPPFIPIIRYCAKISAGMGALALVGWATGFLLLASIRSMYLPMPPNAAIAFVAAGITLYVVSHRPTHRSSLWFIRIAAVLVSLLGLSSVIQYVTGMDFCVGRAFLCAAKTTGKAAHAGFLSPLTGTALILAGISLLLLSFPLLDGKRARTIASGCASAVAVVGLVAVLGYFYGTPSLYGGRVAPMALTAAIAFVFLGIGLIALSGQQYWPLTLVAGDTIRATLVRAFLPIAVVSIILVGWLDTVVFTHWKTNSTLISALLTISSIIAVAVVTSYRAKIAGDIIELGSGNRKSSGEQLRTLSRAVEQSACAIVITDTQGKIEYINPRFTHLTGYTSHEAIGKNPRILQSGETTIEEYKGLWDTINSGKAWHGEFHDKKKNGEFFWGQVSISPVKNTEGALTHFLALIEDVSERKHLEMKLVNQADRDPLTNLFNRRRFQEELEGWLAQARRYGIFGSVLFIDLDNFKYVNDTLGHRAGDSLLKTVANLLRKRVRETDTLARLGGDEFAIILQRSDLMQSKSIAHDIIDLVKCHATLKEGESLGVTASIGIAQFPEHGDVAETLLTHADLAMYQAKEEGRNRVCVYTPNQKTQIELLQVWKKRIRNAIENNRFVLHLQPILYLKNDSIVGYEALLRMKDEKDEIIPPSHFLSIAERLGLIREIDHWVVARAIRTIADFSRNGKPQYLEVNLSGKAISDPELLPLIKRELETSGVNPGNLILEISESAVVDNIGESQGFVATLKDIGCRFALDNFGIGFTSFNNLKRMPFDYLKIDGSFILGLTHSPVDQLLVKAIVDVARKMGKQTIAEHVTSDETIRLLREYGVDYAQGYYIGQPDAMVGK